MLTMDNFSATEQAYKNGYEKGRQDAMKWIPVTERLPTKEDAIDGGFVLANTEEKVIIALWSDVCRFNEFVTHWMPLPKLPQPPKGGAD